jgi:hypothetical protein
MKLDKQKHTQKNLAVDEEFLRKCEVMQDAIESGIWEQVHRTVLHKKDTPFLNQKKTETL